MKKMMFKRTYFAFPYAVLGTVFVILPLFLLLYYVFTNSEGSFTLENFGRFADGGVWKVLGRSFLMAALTTVICLVFAYPLAYVLSNVNINKTAILVLLFVLPMWINSMLRIYAVKLVLEDLVGRGFLLVLIGMVYDFFPFMLLPLYTILANMDKSFIEASADLGAKPLKTFVKIQLPLSVPGIISGILMVFMPTVSTFAISDILGDAENTYLFGNLINYNMEKGNYNMGSVYAIVMLAFVGATVFIANKLSGGKSKATGGGIL